MKMLIFKFLKEFKSEENGKDREESKKINGTPNEERCLCGFNGELSENEVGVK